MLWQAKIDPNDTKSYNDFPDLLLYSKFWTHFWSLWFPFKKYHHTVIWIITKFTLKTVKFNIKSWQFSKFLVKSQNIIINYLKMQRAVTFS